MPSLNFYPRFAPHVASGDKTQSVRSKPFRVGDPVYLFTGLRTTSCRRLGKGRVTCMRDIIIDYRTYVPVIKLDGVTLSSKRMEAFARKDGFPGLDEFMDFFSEHYDLPFRGFVIEWALVAEEAVTANRTDHADQT